MRCLKALLDARPQRCLAVRTVRFDARCFGYDKIPALANEPLEEQVTTAWMLGQGWHTNVDVRLRGPRNPNEPEPDPETHNESSAIFADFPKLPATRHLSVTLHEYGPSFLRAALCITPHITSLKITNGRATMEKFSLPKSPDWPPLPYLREINITLLPDNQPLVVVLLGRYPWVCDLDLVADLNYFDLPCNAATRQKILLTAAELRSPHSQIVEINPAQLHLMETRHPLYKSRKTHCPCPKFDDAFLDALAQNDNLESLGLTGCLADAIRGRRKCGHNMKKLLDGKEDSAKRSDQEREGKWLARIQRHRQERTHWIGNFDYLVDEDGQVLQ
ncbi:hypothetical protein EHS25_005969 [Saitozyma podzolica]|uniref:Uncharacterized protein n=1 Tax=Saitozyma podzolica TaxID=1890683 RepID=A0A427XTV8_9TREE|nr:hypothetical protein EHS25_005969 [Saitozyma podzolica]